MVDVNDKIYNAIIVHPHISHRNNVENISTKNRSTEDYLVEISELAKAINLNIKKAEIINLRKIRSSHFIGKGKIEELANYIEKNEIELFIFNETLTPIQQRNLEKDLLCKVIDRTALILEIFGKRATTKEGVMQVELAHLEYQKSRLVRSWTHLERQRGGGGFMGGPGESQIESDRRIINENIAKIKRQLGAVVKTRGLHRKSRKKIPYPIIALVGYTNAGKSTLFNHLTGASVYAEDALFATLDPIMREVELPSGKKIILSDTVGFISNLPTQLIAAFRATLEEVIDADLILHIRDINSHDSDVQKSDVLKILNDLIEDEINIYEILNKIDLLNKEELANLSKESIKISAIKNIGIDNLLNEIDSFINRNNQQINVRIHVAEGEIIAWLHNHGENIITEVDNEIINIKVGLSATNIEKFKKLYPLIDINI